MTEHPKCEECGKDAIGVQSFGCRSVVVCRDHAHSILRSLGPGQEYTNGDCSFVRFGADGRPGNNETALTSECH